MTQERFEVQDRSDESRYALIDRGEDGGTNREIGEEAYVDLGDGTTTERVFFHTSVSDEYAGQGLASVLVRTAVERTIDAGHAIVPVCPYVVAWLTKHPEYSEHVIEAGPEHLRAIRDRQE